ncbi:MAG: L,D-transpeptidase family protein [Alphaproteobacteria bacterium]|nr:L,D-transpeptidase family protein [Alphaproteobacteria bacterium]
MIDKAKYIFIFISALLCLTLMPLRSAESLKPPPGMAPQPQAVAEVIVFKSERRMELRDKYGNIVRSYRIALGKNPIGHKQHEGDNRTPEGRYMIDTRNPNSDFHLSLRINYPSTKDRAEAKKRGQRPGGDIFIHGMPNGKGWMWWKYNTKSDWTNGCIAVTDREMKEMWELIADRTPIIIQP